MQDKQRLARLVLSLSLLLALVSSAVAGSGLAALSNKDATDGLRQALAQGADVAVSSLGKPNGFYGNPRVKIPLPASMDKGSKIMRQLGMGPQLDQLQQTMNKAAEAAVVEAKPVLLNAVKQMSVNDAKNILAGGDTAATEYFRRTTSSELTARFAPIVKKHTDQLGLAAQYQRFAKPAAGFGLVDPKQTSLDGFVTEKTLDGLFLMVGEEEKAIRRNPLGQSSELLKKVFGSISQ